MYRILLVDDEILVRDAIKENIDWKSMDCELVGDCENGKEAAEFVKEHPVDIVLTDILMPYMDGMELSNFLHDNYPEIVIVIFSGFGEFEYAKKAIQYGVSEYLLKPVTAMELTGVIEKMKKKVEQQRLEKSKMDALTQNSEEYRKNKQIIRSKNIEALVNCTTDVNARSSPEKRPVLPTRKVITASESFFRKNGAVILHPEQKKSVMKFRKKQKKSWDLTYPWVSVNG